MLCTEHRNCHLVCALNLTKYYPWIKTRVWLHSELDLIITVSTVSCFWFVFSIRYCRRNSLGMTREFLKMSMLWAERSCLRALHSLLNFPITLTDGLSDWRFRDPLSVFSFKINECFKHSLWVSKMPQVSFSSLTFLCVPAC